MKYFIQTLMKMYVFRASVINLRAKYERINNKTHFGMTVMKNLIFE